MAFPNSHTGSIPYSNQEQVEKKQLIYRIESELLNNSMVKQISTSADILGFMYKSLFTIQYPVEIKISETNTRSVDYEIKLNKLIQVCIVLAIFIALFSNFKFDGFLWFSAIFTVIFYIINLIVIDKYIRNLIYSVLKNDGFTEGTEEILTKEQMEWIKDKSKCPACGEDITEYDKLCPECGIRLRDKAPQTPSNISKYNGKRIKYHFKQKKP